MQIPKIGFDQLPDSQVSRGPITSPGEIVAGGFDRVSQEASSKVFMAERMDLKRAEIADHKQSMIDEMAGVKGSAAFETAAEQQLDQIKAANAQTPQNIAPQFSAWATEYQSNFLKQAANGRQQELLADSTTRSIASFTQKASIYASNLATQKAKFDFDAAATGFANSASLISDPLAARQDMEKKAAQLQASAGNLKEDGPKAIYDFKQKYAQSYVDGLKQNNPLAAVSFLQNAQGGIKDYLKDPTKDLNEARQAVEGWGQRQAIQTVIDGINSHPHVIQQWQNGTLKLTDLQALQSANDTRKTFIEMSMKAVPDAKKQVLATLDKNTEFYDAMGVLVRKGDYKTATDDPQTVADLVKGTHDLVDAAGTKGDATSWEAFTDQMSSIAKAIDAKQMTPKTGGMLMTFMTNALPPAAKSNPDRPVFSQTNALAANPVYKAYLAGSGVLLHEHASGRFKGLSQEDWNDVYASWLDNMNSAVAKGLPLNAASSQKMAMQALDLAARSSIPSSKNNTEGQ